MAIIGHFRREDGGFSGQLSTLTLKADVRLTPTSGASAKGPAYRVMVGESEVGAAWRAGDASGAVLNLKLDDPAWPEPVSARLMAAEDGVLPLIWIRRVDPEKAADRSPPPPD